MTMAEGGSLYVLRPPRSCRNSTLPQAMINMNDIKHTMPGKFSLHGHHFILIRYSPRFGIDGNAYWRQTLAVRAATLRNGKETYKWNWTK